MGNKMKRIWQIGIWIVLMLLLLAKHYTNALVNFFPGSLSVKLVTVSLAYLLGILVSDRLDAKNSAIIGFIMTCPGLIATVLLRLFANDIKTINIWIWRGSVVLTFLTLLVGVMLLISSCIKGISSYIKLLSKK